MAQTPEDSFLSMLKEADPSFENEGISTTGYIDTGAYALNALISGSIYKGIPNNRGTCWTGPSGTGKTFFSLSVVETFLKAHEGENPAVIYFDTEFALEKEMFVKRGIDPKRIYLLQPESLQAFRTTALKLLDATDKSKPKDRRPMMFVLDSLGNLPTQKELKDGLEGNDTTDMTRAKTIRSIFRSITAKMGRLNIPMIIVNHTYLSVGAYIPTQVSAGGGGIQYAASSIIMLGKKKDKEGNDVVGNIIVAKTDKSRYSKENQKIELKLNYSTGLDKFYGLLPIAEKYGIIVKEGRKYKLADGRLVWEKEILKEPEKVYTKEILDQIDAVCPKEFGLGIGNDDDEPVDIDYESDEEEESGKEE